MVGNQDERESIECAADRGDLLQDVDAICAFADHLLQAAQLTFRAAEPGKQIGVQRIAPRSAFAARMGIVICIFRHTPGVYRDKRRNESIGEVGVKTRDAYTTT